MALDSSKKAKLAVAVVLFVIAAGVFAWQLGWIGGGDRPPKGTQTATPEQQQQMEEVQRQQQADLDAGNVTIGGS
jgi:hypothetical protein